MNRFIALSFLVFSFAIYAQPTQEYSQEFYEYYSNGPLILKGDSILFPQNEYTEVIRIPNFLSRDSWTQFSCPEGHSIALRQINYTDIEFRIYYKTQNYTGTATLLPNFHLGSESETLSDREYFVTKYFVNETNNSCLDYLSLGDQDISKQGPEQLFTILSMSGRGCETELSEMTNQRLFPVFGDNNE